MRKLNHILLVDDDTINNFINEKLLKKTDCTEKISVSVNGQEAMSFLKDLCEKNSSECPDLILLDINMPVMDGFEFMERYKELNFPSKKSTVIVMLTTSTNPNDTKKLDGSGVAGYINKPLTEEKLKEIWEKYFPD